MLKPNDVAQCPECSAVFKLEKEHFIADDQIKCENCDHPSIAADFLPDEDEEEGNIE